MNTAFTALMSHLPAAAPAKSQGSILTGVLWFGGVLFLVVVMIWILTRIRRSLLHGRDEDSVAFTIEELRNLREKGDISDAEFKSLVRRLGQ